MKTVFFRALDADDKAATLLAAIRRAESSNNKDRFEVDPTQFASVPRSPFAYWVSEPVLKLFSELPPVESEGRTAKVGLMTQDDFRFVRIWIETSVSSQTRLRWAPLNKGGSYGRY